MIGLEEVNGSYGRVDPGDIDETNLDFSALVLCRPSEIIDRFSFAIEVSELRWRWGFEAWAKSPFLVCSIDSFLISCFWLKVRDLCEF